MGEIFISYSTKDTDMATTLYNSLKNSGFSCWFAPNDIPLGGDYATRITQALDHVRYVLVVVSQHSGQSDHVKREVSLAADNKKVIIPFRIDHHPLTDWMRYYIAPVNWLEADFENIEESISELIQKIQGMDNMPAYDTETVAPHYGKSALEIKGNNLKASTSKTYIYQVTERATARMDMLYVPFPMHELAEKKLLENRVIFLHSNNHTGKYMTAISLLSNTNVKKYYEISPGISENELLSTPFEEQAGYIIDHLSKDTMDSINAFSFKKLAEQLHHSNSYLIVTTDYSEMEKWNGHIPYIEHHAPTNIETIIVNHLELLQKNEDEIDAGKQLLLESGLLGLLSDSFIPRDAEELAHKLISVSAGRQTIDELLASIKQNVHERIKQWFSKERDLNEYALMLALAVFNESPQQFVQDRADLLEEILADASTPETDEPKAGLFGTSFPDKLADIHAQLYTGLVVTTTGKIEDKFVRFQTKEDAAAVLLYVWRTYPKLKDVILAWFAKLVQLNNKKTNERVIEALSILASDDLLTVQEMIQEWANAKKPYERVLAIHLLLEMAKQKENLPAIDRLINYWASLRNNKRLQWTAAVAYGTPLGIHLYPQSFLNLASMFQSNAEKLGDEIFASMKYLFQFGQQDSSYYLTVPYMMYDWVNRNERDVNQRHRILQLFYSILMNIDATGLNILLSNREMSRDHLPDILIEGLSHWKTREDTEHLLKHMFKVSHSVLPLHEPLQTFTYVLLVKGGTDLKKTLYSILYKILEGPYKNAAIPIVKKIMQLEGRT